MNPVDRRKFIAAMGITLILPSMANAQKEIYLKTIPSTSETIPAIGMGSWLTFDVGEDPVRIAQRTEVLKTFFDMGGALIDSSPMYGSSQAVIGQALSKLDNQQAFFSADKVWIDGRHNGKNQIAQTKRRWGVDQMDLLQIHNLKDWPAHLETLLEMKAAGKLRYVGVTSYAGLRYREIAKIINAHPIDFIQITYNLSDREAERTLLPLANEKGIAVIANRPFNEGSLIDTVNRHPLPGIAAEIGAQNWAQFLLKFIISHPAITVAIPATRRVDHMRENMGALLGPIPDSTSRREMVSAFKQL